MRMLRTELPQASVKEHSPTIMDLRSEDEISDVEIRPEDVDLRPEDVDLGSEDVDLRCEYSSSPRHEASAPQPSVM